MFGVEPTRPATEYGYIRTGPSIGPGLFAIERFVEKPDPETAARYLAEGYLWNSGNFMFRARFLLDEYHRFEPDSAAAVAAALAATGTDLGFVTLGVDAFTRAAAKSIGYAVMERTARATVMPVSYGWSDAARELINRICKGVPLLVLQISMRPGSSSRILWRTIQLHERAQCHRPRAELPRHQRPAVEFLRSQRA